LIVYCGIFAITTGIKTFWSRTLYNCSAVIYSVINKLDIIVATQ
jgi:hypothetical protein